MRRPRPASILGAIAMALAFLFGMGLAPLAAPRPGGRPVLVVLHFNDWHGHLEPFTRPPAARAVGSAARLGPLLATRRDAARARGADVLLLEAGDVLQGTPLSAFFHGEPEFALLQRFGVDAMCLGNHEFDFGQQNLLARLRGVRFPVLAANVRRADGSLFTGRDAVVLTTPRHHLHVAILGLVTTDTPLMTQPRNVVGLAFEDPVRTAARYLAFLRRRADLVIVLSHCGVDVDRRIAALPGVDLVVGGHDHVLLDPAVMVGATPVVQAKEWAEYVGEASFVPAAGSKPGWGGERYRRITEELPADPAVVAFVGRYRARLPAALGRVVARTAVMLDGERDHVNSRETNLGDLVADALRATAGADIALVNGGAIRASLAVGPVTLEQVLAALPFDNRIIEVQLSGAAVRAMLARSLAQTGGGFLQISGMRVAAALDGTLAIAAGGAPLDDRRLYRVALPDFLVAGGDGYREVTGKPARDTGYLLREGFVRFIARLPAPLRVAPDGRLRQSPVPVSGRRAA